MNKRVFWLKIFLWKFGKNKPAFWRSGNLDEMYSKPMLLQPHFIHFAINKQEKMYWYENIFHIMLSEKYQLKQLPLYTY